MLPTSIITSIFSSYGLYLSSDSRRTKAKAETQRERADRVVVVSMCGDDDPLQVVVVVLIYPLVSLLLLTSLGSCLVLYKRAKDKEEEENQRKQEREEKEQESKEVEQHEKAAPGAAEKRPARDATDAEPSVKKPKGKRCVP